MTKGARHGWRWSRLDQCCEVVSGSTPRREVPGYWGGEIPWVTPRDLSSLDGPVLDMPAERITTEGYESCSTTLLPKGAVLFSSRAPVGLVAIAGRPMCTNQGFKNLVPGPDVDSGYLYWCLRRFGPAIERRGSGTTFTEVSKEVVSRFEIPIPPLAEQRRIAAMLDKADALRWKRRESLRLLDEFLRSAFLEMFGDPVRNEKGWVVARLGDCLATKPVLGTITPATEGGEFRLIRVGQLGQHDIPLDRCGRVSVSNDEMARFGAREGDLLLARAIGSEEHLGKASVLQHVPERLVFDSHVMRLRVEPTRLRASFLWQWLQTPGGRRMFLKRGGRTAVQFNINAGQVSDVRLPLPPLEEQERFLVLATRARVSRVKQAEAEQSSETLFSSLAQRAFRTEGSEADEAANQGTCLL